MPAGVETVSTQTRPDKSHNSTAYQTQVRVNQIITQCEEIYQKDWREWTKSQNKLERL